VDALAGEVWSPPFLQGTNLHSSMWRALHRPHALARRAERSAVAEGGARRRRQTRHFAPAANARWRRRHGMRSGDANETSQLTILSRELWRMRADAAERKAEEEGGGGRGRTDDGARLSQVLLRRRGRLPVCTPHSTLWAAARSTATRRASGGAAKWLSLTSMRMGSFDKDGLSCTVLFLSARVRFVTDSRGPGG